MQHLLLGMNAHINLDLGIAAAQTMKDEKIEDVREYFEGINAILHAMINQIEDHLSKVSPAILSLNLHKKTTTKCWCNSVSKQPAKVHGHLPQS